MMQVFWTPGVTLDQMEKMVVQACLAYHNGHLGHTAHALGITERTLYNLRDRYQKEMASEDEIIEDKNKKWENLRAQGYNGPVPVHLDTTPPQEKITIATDKYRSLAEEFAAANEPFPEDEELAPVGLAPKADEEPSNSKKKKAQA